MMERLTRAQVQETMIKVEPQESYSALISQTLQETVFGQQEAADAVARRLALFDTGLSDPKRPLGSMVFLGPTGVGKTEMAHAAAKQMFGDTHSDRLKIINMAEMTKDHFVTRFVGSPPSYVGYGEKPEIPHDWLHKGRSIIVLDEFEKAHPDVRQLFLGALDKGSMNARNGQAGAQPLDFRNTLFIFTSNIGGKEMQDVNAGEGGIGFKTSEATESDKRKRIQGIAERGIRDTLSPEFLNRIDDVVVFHEIQDRVTHSRIFDKFIDYRNFDLRETSETMIRPNPETGDMERASTAPQFFATEEFREHILDVSGNQGGREMKRILERELYDKAADVFMGLDIRGMPLVADHDPQTGDTVFYTDSEPQKAGGEKKEGYYFLPESEDSATGGPSEPTGDSGSSGEQPGTKTPPVERTAGEEPTESSEGGEPPNGPLDHYSGDRGDESDSAFSGWDKRIGIKITVWSEDSVDMDGEVGMKTIEIRNLELP